MLSLLHLCWMCKGTMITQDSSITKAAVHIARCVLHIKHPPILWYRFHDQALDFIDFAEPSYDIRNCCNVFTLKW